MTTSSDKKTATAGRKARILVIDDKEQMCAVLKKFLVGEGYAVETAQSAEQALQIMARAPFDLVLSDVRMPGMSGQQLLDHLRARGDGVAVILMTAFGSIEAAVEALKRGAADYISKPFSMDDVLFKIKRALDERDLRQRVVDLERQVAAHRAARSGELIGNSAAMQRLREIIERVAPLPDTVLITGETGTGKELVARALHEARLRQLGTSERRPFVALDCSAIPESLIEAELFGYERGAFTGASQARPGLFETAAAGTLFLDEVETLTLAVQAKLLRVLQERSVRRLGGRRTLPVAARIIAATNIDLAEAVRQGHFRQDLFYRLAVIPIRVPPLRERREDIPLLIDHLLARRAAERRVPVAKLTPAARQLLLDYDYPGNVRELENIITYVTAFADGAAPLIDVADLPPQVAKRTDQAPATDAPNVPATLDQLERAHILRTLELVGGNQAQAARLLGIDRRTLYNKLRKWQQAERTER